MNAYKPRGSIPTPYWHLENNNTSALQGQCGLHWTILGINKKLKCPCHILTSLHLDLQTHAIVPYSTSGAFIEAIFDLSMNGFVCSFYSCSPSIGRACCWNYKFICLYANHGQTLPMMLELGMGDQ
jgi:hypothetical protein